MTLSDFDLFLDFLGNLISSLVDILDGFYILEGVLSVWDFTLGLLIISAFCGVFLKFAKG